MYLAMLAEDTRFNPRNMSEEPRTCAGSRKLAIFGHFWPHGTHSACTHHRIYTSLLLENLSFNILATILRLTRKNLRIIHKYPEKNPHRHSVVAGFRSEERRVGKECR